MIVRPTDPGLLSHLCSYSKAEPKYFLVSIRNAATWCDELDVAPEWVRGVVNLGRLARGIQQIQGGFSIVDFFSAMKGNWWPMKAVKMTKEALGFLLWLERANALDLGWVVPQFKLAKIGATSIKAIGQWWLTPYEKSLLHLFADLFKKEKYSINLNKFFQEICSRINTVAMLAMNILLVTGCPALVLLQVGTVMNLSGYIQYCLKQQGNVLLEQERYDAFIKKNSAP